MRASVFLEPYYLSIVDGMLSLDYEGVIIGEVSVNTSRVLGLFDFRISSKGARMMTNSWPQWTLELIMKERRLALTC